MPDDGIGGRPRGERQRGCGRHRVRGVYEGEVPMTDRVAVQKLAAAVGQALPGKYVVFLEGLQA